MDDVIALVAAHYIQNAIGEQIRQESRSQIFATIHAISRAEWSEAGQMGLQPSFTAITPAANYAGQPIVEYAGKRYGIYRTYQNGELIEIYCEEKAGDNDDQSNYE